MQHSRQSDLSVELIQYIKEKWATQQILVCEGKERSLAQQLRKSELMVLTEDEAKAGINYTVLVCFNPETEPDQYLTELSQTCQTVLVAWEAFQQCHEDGMFENQATWLSWLAQRGFFPDLNQRPPLAEYQMICLIKSARPTTAHLIAAYERKLWQIDSENKARRALLNEMHDELSVSGFETAEIQVQLTAKIHRTQETIDQLRQQNDDLKQTIDQLRQQNDDLKQTIDQLRQQNDDLKRAYQEIYNSRSWRLMRQVHSVRHKLIPPGSLRERKIKSFFRSLVVLYKEGPLPSLKRAYRLISWRIYARIQKKQVQSTDYLPNQTFTILPVAERSQPIPHTAQIDVIVCVHNALEDVRRCLESVLSHSNQPYRLILVDDGSQSETRDYLAKFAGEHECTLLRNETARGYTCAANQGMQAAQGDFAVLLNSDTILTSGWLDKLTACALSDDKIGIVGPLSNTASWQSIPLITENGDWAMNPLPANLTVDEMGILVEAGSARLYPEMKLLNGFCLFIRRAVREQIGLFDEEHFGAGYGEEDDYCLRARAAGWKLALADDTYIYHAQSKSYSTERRKQLYERAGKNLRDKHGEAAILAGVEYNQHNPVLQGIRARSQLWLARQDLIAAGKRSFAGKRVLFVLPIMFAGGGGNVIISESYALRRMGVDVHFFNLPEYRQAFERSYPDLPIPVIYASEQELLQIGSRFDAVIATINTSVAWLRDIVRAQPQVRLGYYVQGFEPLMYPEGSPEHQNALQSYTLFPELIPFTKTAWTRQQVQDHTGAVCQIVGPSLEIDLFRPRPAIWRAEEEHPIKIAAMVRADSAYRSPHLTMQVLQKASWRYGSDVEILLFGIDPEHPEFARLPVEFAWRATGLLSPRQVARLMNEIDIFVDFSQHQAMGLSALEAMACGAAVIAPQNGGAVEFVRDGQNGLVVDTSSLNACWQGLTRLIEDSTLRRRIQDRALADVCQYFPERAAHNILKVLFNA